MKPDRPIPDFSPREKELLQYAAAGFTDSAIANKLGISEATVGTYWGRVRIKLGPYSRTELVAIVLRAESEAALGALKQENEQLIHQLQADMASNNSEFYRVLLDNAPDAMIIVDDSGDLQYANAAAADLFGYVQAAMKGMDLVTLIPERYRKRHREHRAEYFHNPIRRQMGAHLETPAVRKDGTEFLIRAVLSATETSNGVVVICAIRPAEII